MNITLNSSCQAFVLDSSDGTGTLGYRHVFSTLQALAKRLGLDYLMPRASEIGTLHQYGQYRAALSAAANRNLKTTWYSPGTPVAVRKILERYRIEGGRIRLFYGDPATGRDWLEENDVVGTVGRSSGTLKVPLLIPPGDCGGPAISDNCLIRLCDADSGEELWRCRNYRVPTFRIVESGDPKLNWAVEVNGALHARFVTCTRAAAWVAFMSGEPVHGEARR